MRIKFWVDAIRKKHDVVLNVIYMLLLYLLLSLTYLLKEVNIFVWCLYSFIRTN